MVGKYDGLNDDPTCYSLPWDQIGYWAVKIVTGVPEAIPVIGSSLVELLRGSSSYDNAFISYALIDSISDTIGVNKVDLKNNAS
ncbi:unnamed protein product [Sphenostylis stenocarpa]|uniref:Cytochrome b/b6 N-terminal region profile domain-containing protein n=1 Tax=Sphenostylis stenocarpa TaxID=92480 RepID=A0AA86VQZ9_9FABA|nr:unnamed protein product [Sphenostylis stenocarpa]CAJ1975021.1 unnamed protein product [Sphenostylis stenocarpa]